MRSANKISGIGIKAGFTSFLLVFALLGCVSYPDKNKDPQKNNLATFEADALNCAKSYPESNSGAHVKQRIGCMNIKGWH